MVALILSMQKSGKRVGGVKKDGEGGRTLSAYFGFFHRFALWSITAGFDL